MASCWPEAAARFVRERYGDRAGALTEVGRGDWSRAYRFRLDGAERVVKFSERVADLAKDSEAARLASAAVPVPAIVDEGRPARRDLVHGCEVRRGCVPRRARRNVDQLEALLDDRRLDLS